MNIWKICVYSYAYLFYLVLLKFGFVILKLYGLKAVFVKWNKEKYLVGVNILWWILSCNWGPYYDGILIVQWPVHLTDQQWSIYIYLELYDSQVTKHWRIFYFPLFIFFKVIFSHTYMYQILHIVTHKAIKLFKNKHELVVSFSFN